MDQKYVYVTILLLCWNFEVKCWVNYRFSFLTSKINSVDSEILKFHNFDVMKKNRTYSYLYINATALKPTDNITLSVRLLKYTNNHYKDTLSEFKVDACNLISTKPLKSSDSLSANFFAKLKKPLHQTWNGPGQNFPQECPVMGNYHSRMHFNEEDVPIYFWPVGRWKVNLDFYRGKRVWTKLTFDFDLSTYLTEKQKNKG